MVDNAACGTQRGPCRRRVGIVTTHPHGGYLGGPHYAADCCGSARCVERLKRAAKRVCGLDASYVVHGRVK